MFIFAMFSIASINKKYASHFRREPANENKQFKELKKHEYLVHTWSDKALKGTVVNRALAFLHGDSLEITLTVPLSK